MLTRSLLFVLWLFSLIPKGIRAAIRAVRQFLKDVKELFGGFAMQQRKKRRRWFFRIGKPEEWKDHDLSREQVERLMRRSRALLDFEDLSRMGRRLVLPETDFTVSRNQVSEILRRIIEANPPFLFLGRVLPDPKQADSAPPRLEKLRKREIVQVNGLVDLLIPEERPISTHHDLPSGDQAMRPALHIHEIRRAALLDRVLPPRLQMERLAHGDLMVLEYVRTTPRVEFIPRQRWVEYEEEREVEVEIELEATDPDESAQLIYFLLDTSASMKGISATLAASVFCAIHRANMATNALYFMRTFADHIEPGWDQPPMRAHTLGEREALFEGIFSLNFNGTATHTGWALEIACKDIQAARGEDPSLSRAHIVLITDGRSDILPETVLAVRKTGAPLHTIMVSRERNRDLEHLSESFTTLAGLPELADTTEEGSSPPMNDLPTTTDA